MVFTVGGGRWGGVVQEGAVAWGGDWGAVVLLLAVLETLVVQAAFVAFSGLCCWLVPLLP